MSEVNCMNCIVTEFREDLCEEEFCEKFRCARGNKDFIEHVLEVARPHGEWIPCSERLPPYSERIVLATVVRRDKTWNNDPYHRLVTYSQGKWYPLPQSVNLVPCHMATIEQSDGGQAEVIAWMPLPEPYKAESEE